MLTDDGVREALRVCFDPELPVNIVDLGLVESIRLAPDQEAPGTAQRFVVTVTLLRRTEDEQREAMLQAQVSNRLSGMYEISKAAVHFTDATPWTAERMSDDARRHLGLDRSPGTGLVQITL